jgi:hypothetical protein
VKTLWEVAEESGLRTSVMNWWASWPAPASGGIVVTDRALLRLERGGALDAEIAPAALYEPLRTAWPSIRERARAQAAELESADPSATPVLRRSAELDASIVGLAMALPPETRDLDVIYLPGLDIAQHALLGGRDGAAQTPSALATRVDAVRAYYGFLKRILAPILVPTERVNVMIVAQPGRVDSAAPGVIASYRVFRFGVAPGLREVPPGHVEDVAPTVLNALGVPLSRELTGTPLPLVLAGQPARYVETYGRPSTTTVLTAGKPLDQETIDRLRSLGYIK